MFISLEAVSERIRAIDPNMVRICVVEGEESSVVKLRYASPVQSTGSISRAFTLTGALLLMEEGGLHENEPACECEDAPTVGMLLRGAKAQNGDNARILARLMEKRTGMHVEDYLWKRLFRPLGFRDAAWSHDRDGCAMGSAGLYLRTEDMAKLGALYAGALASKAGGILSAESVRRVKTGEYDLSPMGFDQIRPTPGLGGQAVFALPEKTRAVAWQSALDLPPTPEVCALLNELLFA